MRTKEDIRADYKRERREISSSRREKAEEIATNYLSSWLEERLRSGEEGKVLSFAPLKEEINLWPFNQLLAQKKLLALPRVEKNTLIPHIVNNLSEDLETGAYGIVEPKKSCKATENVFAILVPAIAFDNEMHRLGFGKGHYDRFLATQEDIPLIGIGFREQLFPLPLPIDKHDIKLTHRLLF